MNWNPQMEVHYINTGCPYSTTASFMEFFEGLTYDHINFVFSDPLHNQENMYSSANANSYKYGFLDCGMTSYCDDHPHDYEITDHTGRLDEFRRPFGTSSLNNATALPINTIQEGYPNTTLREGPTETRRNHGSQTQDTQVAWQDTIDPDTMSYEELLELGETVGAENRGLSKEVISLLPISRYKRWFFWRRKSRNERCVVCQMEYKRGDRQIILPCKHAYHAGCGAKWLSINKACPICYTDVVVRKSKPKK
ncbi:unnamed protein product [Rhodiola kirilowii]